MRPWILPPARVYTHIHRQTKGREGEGERGTMNGDNMSAIPSLGRSRQLDCKSKASLSSTGRNYLGKLIEVDKAHLCLSISSERSECSCPPKFRPDNHMNFGTSTKPEATHMPVNLEWTSGCTHMRSASVQRKHHKASKKQGRVVNTQETGRRRISR